MNIEENLEIIGIIVLLIALFPYLLSFNQTATIVTLLVGIGLTMSGFYLGFEEEE